MLERRQLIVWGYLAAGVAGGCIFVAPLRLLPRPHPGLLGVEPSRILLATAAASLAMGWTVIFARLAFLRLDEFQREGSKYAWYWGGTIGLAVSAPLYAFIGLGGLHWLFPASFHLEKGLFRAFAVGYALPIVLQLCGWCVAAAWWRIGRR